MDANLAQLAHAWRTANARLFGRVRQLQPEDLSLRSAPDYWPIWAIVGHVACARVYWVCDVLKQPGVESTPFPDAASDCWEDHLDTPRGTDELLPAIDSSWKVVEDWLNHWTPQTLEEKFSRIKNGSVEWHTYQYVFMRLVMHDAYHAGEISVILGAHGLEAIEPWSGLQLVAPH